MNEMDGWDERKFCVCVWFFTVLVKWKHFQAKLALASGANLHDALMCGARELLGELQVQVSRALVATRNPTVF
ncbi:hypothetical protein ACFX1T_007080 [Malus domestica]